MKTTTLLSVVALLGLTASLCTVPRALAANEELEQAATHHVRTEQNKARDQYRNPVATLAFFDVTPHSSVVEISPGAGWYTEILAPLLAAHGNLYAAHFPADTTSEYGQRARANFVTKLASDPIYRKVQLTAFAPLAGVEVAPAGSADVVLTFRNLHNWYMAGGEEAMLHAFNNFYTALKPGGVLGVVEHRLPESRLDTNWTRSGYFPQSLAVKIAEQAGFVFEASSEINANPKDTADHPNGVWTLPPSLRVGDADPEIYKAIGESDRMTLKFRKPLAQ
ncbi:class I SAM-dependent methyltransferase [Arsukibacterium sp.]|uniref:class I SAM-dependent methyltransferase n=1 Tax=Arsukibacterium sp. TaxID=1977258 RepID=UPI002FD92BE6